MKALQTRSSFLALAALATALVVGGLSRAATIDFETLPGGGTPTDNGPLGLTATYQDGATFVSFGWDTDNDLVADVAALFESHVVDSGQGYVAGPSNTSDLDLTPNGQGGDFFLRRPGGVNPNPGGDDFLISYSGFLPTSASGEIWDLDAGEHWQIDALDIGGGVIATINTPVGNNIPNDPNNFDGLPYTFSFNNLSVGIQTIRISLLQNNPNVGFAFDNFNATQPATVIPEPASLAMGLTGLALMGFYARRKRLAKTKS